MIGRWGEAQHSRRRRAWLEPGSHLSRPTACCLAPHCGSEERARQSRCCRLPAQPANRQRAAAVGGPGAGWVSSSSSSSGGPQHTAITTTNAWHPGCVTQPQQRASHVSGRRAEGGVEGGAPSTATFPAPSPHWCSRSSWQSCSPLVDHTRLACGVGQAGGAVPRNGNGCKRLQRLRCHLDDVRGARRQTERAPAVLLLGSSASWPPGDQPGPPSPAAACTSERPPPVTPVICCP